MVFLGVFGVIFIGIVILSIIGKKRNPDYRQKARKEFRFSFLHPAALVLVERFQGLLQNYWHTTLNKIIRVYGEDDAVLTLKAFIAELISAFIVIFSFFLLLAGLKDSDYSVFFMGVFLSGLYIYNLIHNLDQKIEERKQEIEGELPDFISKLTLLVNAGESIQNALINIVKSSKVKSALYEELRQVVSELEYGISFSQSIDEFSKRCMTQQVTVLSTVLLLNYRRGGEELSNSLKSLVRDAWENKKSIVRVKAEEASSKLVFPMMGIFLIVAFIVVVPVLLLMA